MAINPTLYKSIAYDPLRDFVPINFYLKSPVVLCVNPSVKATTVDELIKEAKTRDKPFTFGSPGAGTTMHLSVEYLKAKFDVDMTTCPTAATRNTSPTWSPARSIWRSSNWRAQSS